MKPNRIHRLGKCGLGILFLLGAFGLKAQNSDQSPETSILSTWSYEGKYHDVNGRTPRKTAEGEEAEPQSRSSFVGFYLGQRTFSEVPQDVFLQTGDSSLSLLDMGKGRPLALGVGFMFQPEEKGLAVPFWIDGFLGATSGIGFGIGVGYKVGSPKFSFTPNVSFGLGRIWTHIETLNIDSMIVPAAFFEAGNQSVFVGNGVNPPEVGGGGNLQFTLGSAFFHAKLAVNISGRITEKMFLFGDIGYNLVYASTKNRFDITGQGYENMDAFLAQETPPQLIGVELEGQGIVDRNNVAYEKTPYNLSGLALHFGLGFRLD